MRTLSSAATTLLANKFGIKPIVLMKIYWQNPVIYGETENTEFNVRGKLLTISSIEDVINLTGSTNSVTLSAELDDSDLSLKTIFNNTDIHGVRVDILQWFDGFHINDAFLLFQGELATPIVYNEKGKTLKFDVINRIEDREIGFSIEEGQFTYVPAGTVGKMWPLVFGTVASVPALQIAEPPSAIMAEGTGIVIDAAWDQELAAIELEIARAHANMISEFILGLQEAYLAAAERTNTQTDDNPFGDNTANSHDQAAQQHFRQADQYRLDEFNIGLTLLTKQQEKRDQQKYVTPSIKLVSLNLPQNTKLTLKAGDAIFTGVLQGNLFSVQSRDVPVKINKSSTPTITTNTNTLSTFQTPETRDKFYWIDGGTQVSAMNFPLKFILGMGNLNVLSVKAKQSGIFVKVPTEYYTIQFEIFETLTATTLILAQPLTSYNDDITKWEGNEIYVDVVSPIGNNVVDILIYLIENYTSLSFDVDSFNHVKTFQTNYPANFVLTQRDNTVKVLSDIAFQARCQIWVNDQKFYLRYLPEEQAGIDTITEADIYDEGDVNIQITTNATEEIVTKFVAQWKADQTQNSPYEITYRYNVDRFGVKEEIHNFYIYNNIESVKKSAEFWSIQKANLWKRVTFSLFLQKIQLETFDSITLNFSTPIVSNDPVVGLIERAVYNSEQHTIDVEVKLPIRFGEMDKYVFAAPKDVTENYPVQNDPFRTTGNPLSQAKGDITNGVLLTDAVVGLNLLQYRSSVAGRDGIIGDQADNPTKFAQVVTVLDQNEISGFRPPNLTSFNDVTRFDVKNPKPIDKPASGGTSSYAGFVLERFKDNLYFVSTFLNGLANVPTTILVEQFAHPNDDEITINTPCVVYSGKGTLETTKYLMFVPVWMQQNA